jgi:WD40 repeat protein
MFVPRMVIWWLFAASLVSVAQNCPLPLTVKPISREKNIFSDAQEAELTDIMAESNAYDFEVIHDDVVNAHLQQLGNRLIRYLPPNQFRFRFLLMDLQTANALSFPGGLVYVSRKLVTLARNDDELAGVLAHELGHIVTHQGAIHMTLVFRQVLGVNEFSSRADIAGKYHQLLDSWRRHPPKISDKEEEDQLVADQIALYAMARAGFAPQAWPDLLDRLQQTQGKTGTWLSDLFGTTRPEQRRLRESLKSMAAMPSGCSELISSTSVHDFEKWQQEVISYDVKSRTESLTGVIFKQTLELPLRPDINRLRFSPNGKFLLAQDSGGIHVLSRAPLAPIFFIDALDANKAMFSPDSKAVVFYTPNFRVEIWDIESQKRTAVYEMILHEDCLESELSPDGNFLACFTTDFTLQLFKVAGSTVLATKKNFLIPDWGDIFRLEMRQLYGGGGTQFSNLGFSPDGHYFIAGTHSATFAFDLIQNQEAGLPPSIRNLAHNHFAFAGPDRIIGLNASSPKKSSVYRFPTGEHLQSVALTDSIHLGSVTRGDYVLVWPLKENPLGILDLHSDTVFTFQHGAADTYDNVLLYELQNGQVALSDLATQKTLAAVALKQARLGGIRSVAVTDDFELLAISTRTRGAVWDLTHNMRRAYVRGFDAAWFGPDHALYADFPKKDVQERAITRLDLQGGANIVYQFKEEDRCSQEGPYLVFRKSAADAKADRKGWTLDLVDYRTKAAIWSHNFSKGFPRFSWNSSGNTVLMSHPIYTPFAQEELKQFPDLKRVAGASDYFLERFDIQKNTLTGKLLINTNKGSFQVENANADGDWVALETSDDRVITFSLLSGQENAHVFGSDPVLSSVSGLFAVSTATGEVNVYKLNGGAPHRHFGFPATIAYKKFSPDGNRLLVVTRDQTAYVLDLKVTSPVPEIRSN